MKIIHTQDTSDASYEPFFVALLPHVFDCMIRGSYGWCRFTDHDYGDFRENSEVVKLIDWLKAQPGRFHMEQCGQGDIETWFTLYIENPDTALLFKLTWA